jgi:hypothetical protein
MAKIANAGTKLSLDFLEFSSGAGISSDCAGFSSDGAGITSGGAGANF